MIVLVPIVVSVLVGPALVRLRFVGLEEGVPVVEYLLAFAYAAVVVNEEFGRDRSGQRGRLQRERHIAIEDFPTLGQVCVLGLLRRRFDMKAQFSHRAADEEEERRIKGLSPSKIDEEEHDRRVSVVDINPTIVSGEASKLGYYVSIYKLTGATIGPFHLDNTATVGDLKARVQAAEGVPPEQQRLFFEIPKSSGSVVGDSEANIAPGVPATQIHGWTPEWPKQMQRRPLRKGRCGQRLSALRLGSGFERGASKRPEGSVALSAWLVLRPSTPGMSDAELDDDDEDIEPINLAERHPDGHLNLRRPSMLDGGGGSPAAARRPSLIPGRRPSVVVAPGDAKGCIVM